MITNFLMSQKLGFFIALLFCFITGSAQNFKDLDSLLIDRDIDNYSIRFFTNYKVNKFSVLNSYYDVKFTPNNRHGVGFGVANKKMILDIGFNLKNPNKEETARFDFQGTAIIKKRNYTDLYIQSYKGFQAKNNFGESSVFRGDMRSVSFGFSYLYTLDEIEFSYSLLKAGLLDEDDKDVFITGGLGVFGMFDYFSSDTSVLSEIALEYFNEQADIKRYQGVTVGVMGGAISYFKIKEDIKSKNNNKSGVITRGKIKLSKQIDFWLNVSSASDAIKNANGVEFYKGIGELPLLSQATFSVWKNHKSISDFAYKNKAHSEIIKKTRDRKWYSEDLFARFEIKEIKTQDF